MKIITLLTDFTDRDGYVGIMKGVILGIINDVHIIDLSHSIPPQNITAAARLLGRSAPFFAPGSVHIAVVDPGVGTSRRGIIAQLGKQYFVGPDNGLMTLLYRQAQTEGDDIRVHALEYQDYQLSPVSRSFHGRDVFAPAAAYFLRGVALDAFGQPVNDPILLHTPEPKKINDGWLGEIVHMDAFGNLASNLRVEHLENFANVRIMLRNKTIAGIKTTFGDGDPGELVAIIDSFGFLCICVVNGSAANLLDADVGEAIQVTLRSS